MRIQRTINKNLYPIGTELLKSLLIAWYLLFFGPTFAQAADQDQGITTTIAGYVFNEKTREPLVGASVYFDNTTIGTSTDFDGYFELDLSDQIKTGLVISFLGYKSVYKTKLTPGRRMRIYLEPDSNVLEEVVVSTDDTWSRELKLKEFRKRYLGESKRGQQCSILNEEDLILVFSKKRKRMYARTRAPLRIVNPTLKYEINADLRAFAVNYAKLSKNENKLVASSVSYKGFNRYTSLDSTASGTVEQAREQAYLGSVLHFMRSLASKDLEAQGYRIRYKGKFVPPGELFSVVEDKKTGYTIVRAFDLVEIVYRSKFISVMQLDAPEFMIDPQGNHSPVDKVRFGGEMGSQRMGDTLPLDFLSDK